MFSCDVRDKRLPLLCAAALILTAGTRAASAQTVMVRSALAGAKVELTMNDSSPVTATADNSGDATLAVPARTRDVGVKIFVDSCSPNIKVVLVDNGRQPDTNDAGCTRKEMWGVYMMSPTTTFVFDFVTRDPTVAVSQGPPPPEWLRHGSGPIPGRHNWGTAGKGLSVGAGLGLSSFGNTINPFCGTASACTKDTSVVTVSLDADYWFAKHFAAHLGYLRPNDPTASGSDSHVTFDSNLKVRLLTIGGKVGGGKGPARFYAMGGVDYHSATSTTTNVITDSTVTTDSGTQTLQGGTQSFGEKTTGTSWFLGGGLEIWVTNHIAIMGEVQRFNIKGSASGDAVGSIDTQSTAALLGVRVRLTR